jgi:hypothetical protein
MLNTGRPIVRRVTSAATMSASGVEWLTQPWRLLPPQEGTKYVCPEHACENQKWASKIVHIPQSQHRHKRQRLIDPSWSYLPIPPFSFPMWNDMAHQVIQSGVILNRPFCHISCYKLLMDLNRSNRAILAEYSNFIRTLAS